MSCDQYNVTFVLLLFCEIEIKCETHQAFYLFSSTDSLKYEHSFKILYGPRREKNCLLGSDKARLKPTCSATETSLYQAWIWYFTINEKKRRLLVYAYAQAGMCLCCWQTTEDRFSHGEAQLSVNYSHMT